MNSPLTVQLSADNLSVAIDKKELVKNISLSIKTGEWLCIVGPNGAGKSTLLKALAGITPSNGTLFIDSHDVSQFNTRDRACWIAYVPQEPASPAGMRVFDYVLLGRTAHLNLLASESPKDLEITQLVIDELGLNEFIDREVATLSGGERQRVAIARALVQASPIVLLDEPTSALDVGYQQEVLELIDRLRRENRIAVISTMHDLTVAGLFPDHLILLKDGEVLTQGTAVQVLTEENIQAAYGADVRVINDGEGPIVVPMRKANN